MWCSRTVASSLPSAASGGTGPSLYRPYLVWGLGCVSLAPLHLADQGGPKTQPDSATDLLGQATPCHLWVSVSSAERQMEYCWAASGEKGQADVSLGTQKGWCEGPEHLPSLSSQPGLIMSSGHVAGGHVWGCYWYLMGRCQRCCSMSYNAQDSPTTRTHQQG